MADERHQEVLRDRKQKWCPQSLTKPQGGGAMGSKAVIPEDPQPWPGLWAGKRAGSRGWERNRLAPLSFPARIPAGRAQPKTRGRKPRRGFSTGQLCGAWSSLANTRGKQNHPPCSPRIP